MPAPLGETLEGGPQSLPCRPALQVGPPLWVFPPVELEPQELKPPLVRRRLSIKRDPPRLRHRWLYPKLAQPLWQHPVEPFGIFLIFKCGYEIIRISDQARFTPALLLHHLVEPQVQHVVQVDVG